MDEKLLVAALSGLNARRKADREAITRRLLEIASHHGAQVERRDESRAIRLRFVLGDVGAMIHVNDTHGGDSALIHWHNAEAGPARLFSGNFAIAVGSGGARHHKATSIPADWIALAKRLDAGLSLAASGLAFTV